MADAKPGVYASQLRKIIVDADLVQGNTFIKWDEDTPFNAATVVVKVDPKGHVLYWIDQVEGVETLDICSIRDTRTGRQAHTTKDSKVKELSLSLNAAEDSIEDRTVTICRGTDLVNLQWLNFVAPNKSVAQKWTDELFSYAQNILARNPSVIVQLERGWTSLYVKGDVNGLIPVKSIFKRFSTHKEDQKRVEKALQSCAFPHGKKEFIKQKEFTFVKFLQFHNELVPRTDLKNIFETLKPKKKPYPHLDVDQFITFLNETQRDPRLNEILYPYATPTKAMELIKAHEKHEDAAKQGRLTYNGFVNFLFGEENLLLPADKLDLSQDMDQPLAHYFINSSHNTYLGGHQLTGKSSSEIYRQVLLTGCRCVELDIWDGKGADEEPVITHGFTMCTEVAFRDVLEAIADSAFKVSKMPVILSFENHCTKQHKKMVELIKHYLGDKILSSPLPTHPLEPGVPLPSPFALKEKFLIKNKKRLFKKGKTTVSSNTKENAANSAQSNRETSPQLDEIGSSSQPDVIIEDGIETEELDDPNAEDLERKDPSLSRVVMVSEISAMVNYIEPVPYESFEISEAKSVSYECTSFVETLATLIVKEQAREFMKFNRRQISRIYPKGTRVDSSNYNPQIFWNVGCQLVALNFQTLDLPLQINLGVFEYQHRCGYLLKPRMLRDKDREFDPFVESGVDSVVANTLSIRIISGLLLSDRRVGTYVEVDMFGLPADTVRKRFRTARLNSPNALNPVYSSQDADAFVIKKVVFPELAVLRIAVYEDTGRFIGHRMLPVDAIRPGYRHVTLKNELNQPMPMATLFVHIIVKDYVPDRLADLAAALSNPIAFISELDKHTQQLSVLTDDFESSDTPVNQHRSTANSDSCNVTRASRQISAGTATTSNIGGNNMNNCYSLTSTPMHYRSPAVEKDGVSLSDARSSNPPGGTFSHTQQTSSTQHRSSFKAIPQRSTPSRELGITKSLAEKLPSRGFSGHTNTETSVANPQLFIAKTVLIEASCVTEISLRMLRGKKRTCRLWEKMEKELACLQKKHEKALQIAAHKFSESVRSESHSSRRVRTSSERKGLSSSHKLDPHNEISHSFQSDDNFPTEGQNSDQHSSHATFIESIEQQQMSEEIDCVRHYIAAYYSEVRHLLDAEMATANKKLVNVYKQELNVLCNLQARSHKEEIRLLCDSKSSQRTMGPSGKSPTSGNIHNRITSSESLPTDKQELARRKREIQNRHIETAVQERQKLKELFERRQEELNERNKSLLQEIADDEKKELSRIEREIQRKHRSCSQLLKS